MKSVPSPSSSYFTKFPSPSPNSERSILNCTYFKSPSCMHTSKSGQNSSFPLSLASRANELSSSSSFSSRVVTSSPSPTSDLSAEIKLERLTSEFRSLSNPVDRVKRLLEYAAVLPPFEESLRTDSNRVMGCTAQVWLGVRLEYDNKMRFKADSDSDITKGFCACLISVLDGASPEEVISLNTQDLGVLSVSGLHGRNSSRANTWHNVLISMQKRTKALVAAREGKPPSELFPSMVITADGIQAQGSYAQAQAQFLLPDESKIEGLVNVLSEKKVGVVAHFYMDPEVQGVLTAAQEHWPHIHISDSLVMADSAVKMAEAGCQYITVLGVDFMSENVRAILDQAGFPEVKVFRMSNERIGCSLADAASDPAYMTYLEAASVDFPSLHVVYINTSLETKANAHELVPTITCTSSNVVPTILQAFAQIPDLKVYYGPDTYMGANIVELFEQMTLMADDEIAEIHPEHNRSTIRSLLPRLHYYQDGTCIVHHLFGHEVVEKIKDVYCDAFLTAHFEVPGEMFSLAMEAKQRGMGIVGSTQNILDFISGRVQEALDRNVNEHLQFVLGTESGMITSIVAKVRKLLSSVKSSSMRENVSVEIVFPVSSESVMRTPQSLSDGANLVGVGPVIPGVASGEGCSLHGGCASCPYMKMNSLGSLLELCHQLPDGTQSLLAYEAARFSLRTRQGKLIADVGCEPILNMRYFQANKKLPQKLIDQILHANGNGRSDGSSLQ